ncbi:tripartite tricarboxylate transporter substrate binding protein [Antarctobacter sp.]|uniref:tripartite tricarboxylate transporter substrate binding protein n=1 Tax=Antarctobacter sp. TaxID=1872577 RepID=UPI003A939C67
MAIAKLLKMPFLIGGIALTASVAAVTSAAAQDACSYPEQPVSIIVGYSPGGGTDTIARLLANGLTEVTGQPFNVVNKPGGAQVPAMKFVMDAEKDGYTLEFFSTGSAVMATLLRDQGFTFMEEFKPVANVAISTSVLAVNKSSGVTTGEEMIAWIKETYESGSKLRYGHAGRGSSSHIAIAAWLEANDLYGMVQDVPFDGSGPARAALIGEQVDFTGMNIANVEKDEVLHGVGTLSETRDPAVDHVPTMKEQGIPYVDMDGPLLLAAPTGTPQEVIDCLEASVKQVSGMPSFVEAMNKAGFAVIYQDSQTITNRMAGLIDGWKAAVDSVLASARSN